VYIILLILCNLLFLIFVIILGDITQKGYEKKRAKLLSPYLSSQQKPAGISDCTAITVFLDYCSTFS